MDVRAAERTADRSDDGPQGVEAAPRRRRDPAHPAARRASHGCDGPTSLLLGVPERAAMEVMGWSHSAMAKRYQHVTAVLRQDIAARLDGFLWGGG